MTEQQYKELLQTLGINVANSNLQIKELLEAKLNEYLDRTDAEAEQKASDVQDAMDYLEDLIVKMGGGIALAPEETEETEEGSQNSFTDRTAGRKGAITYTSSSAVSGASTGSGAQGTTTSTGATNQISHPWFYSTTGDKNIEDLFKLAEGDLAQGDYQHAKSVYDTILRTEMTNAGAYMGKVLARYKLQEPKDIATCFTQGLENDSDLKRVENCGNDKQKKFIKDALEERRQAIIYIEADKVLNTSTDTTKILDAANDFDSLGSYRDAAKKADECRKAVKKVEEEEKRRREEERIHKEKEKQRREEEELHQRETKRKEEKRKKRNKVIFIAFVIILAAVIYKGTKIGDEIDKILSFGDVYINGDNEEQKLTEYHYIKKATIENATDVHVSDCRNLEELTVKESDYVDIFVPSKIEKIGINSVEELFINGEFKFKNGNEPINRIDVVDAKKIAIYNCVAENWNITGSIEELKLCGCSGLSRMAIDKDIKNVIITDCDTEEVSFENGFSGSIEIEGINAKDILVPNAATKLRIDRCKYLENLTFEQGFAGDIQIMNSDVGNILIPKDTSVVIIENCPELMNVTFENGFSGVIVLGHCNKLTTDNFVIPDAAEVVSISSCENLEDYSRGVE